MPTDASIAVGVNKELTLRSNLVPNRPCIILSAGYGVFGYEEPVQLALIDALEELDVGWVQYQYLERDGSTGTTDLLISSGLHALRATCRWTRFNVAGPVGLFGISFGANISLEAALLERPAILLLVNPVFDYVDYRTKQLGNEAMDAWAKTGVASISYLRQVLSYYRFIEEARGQQLLKRARGVLCPVVVCQGEADPILGTRYVQEFATVCPHAETHVIPGADHSFASPEAIKQFVKLAEGALHGWFRADPLATAA